LDKPKVRSSIRRGEFVDLAEDRPDVVPGQVDWEFPLRYIPKPPDVDQILANLDGKYSVSSLLALVKNS
jgi:hypothetical protein